MTIRFWTGVLRIFVFASMFSVLMSVYSAQIYRSIDEKGILRFSDRKSGPAQRVELETPAIVSVPNHVRNPFDSTLPDEKNSTETAIYKSLSIVTPDDGATVRNTQEIVVRITLEPKMVAGIGHKVVLYLNSEPYVFASSETSVTLSGLERGEHVLQAVVLDSNQVELIRATPIVFYLHRHSRLHSRDR
jgi:hypothetical protein